MKINNISITKPAILIVAMILIAAFPASATTIAAFKGLENVLTILQGPVGITLGTIAIIGAGAAIAVTKGQGVGTLFWVIIGFSIVFGAGTLVTQFFPNATTSGFVL